MTILLFFAKTYVFHTFLHIFALECTILVDFNPLKTKGFLRFQHLKPSEPLKNQWNFNILTPGVLGISQKPKVFQRFFKVSAPEAFRTPQKPMEFQYFDSWSPRDLSKTKGFSKVF